MNKSKFGTFSLGQKVIAKQGKRKFTGTVTKLFEMPIIEVSGHLCFIDRCKSA